MPIQIKKYRCYMCNGTGKNLEFSSLPDEQECYPCWGTGFVVKEMLIRQLLADGWRKNNLEIIRLFEESIIDDDSD